MASQFISFWIFDGDPISSCSVRSFKTWELPAEEEPTPDSTQEYRYEPPEIIELLAVNAQTLPLFSKLGLRSVNFLIFAVNSNLLYLI